MPYRAAGVPVCLFVGRQDRIADLAQIEEWYAALNAPATRLEVIDGAGHLNLYEQPSQFLAEVPRTHAHSRCEHQSQD